MSPLQRALRERPFFIVVLGGNRAYNFSRREATVILGISASYLRTLERQLNDGKPFDAEMMELLKDAMHNISDPELARSLERHMEG